MKNAPKKVSLQSGDGSDQNGTHCLPAGRSTSRVGPGVFDHQMMDLTQVNNMTVSMNLPFNLLVGTPFFNINLTDNTSDT